MERWAPAAEKTVKMDSPGRREYDQQEEKRRIEAASFRQAASLRQTSRRKKWLESAPVRRRANQQIGRRDRQSETYLRAAYAGPLPYRSNRSDAEAAARAQRSDRRDSDAHPQGSRTDEADHWRSLSYRAGADWSGPGSIKECVSLEEIYSADSAFTETARHREGQALHVAPLHQRLDAAIGERDSKPQANL